MSDSEKAEKFKAVLWPHLPAAYNLARWLMRRDADAEDAVQEAMLRAFRFFDGYRGGEARAWLLAIVRNCCYAALSKDRAGERENDPELIERLGDASQNPEAAALKSAGTVAMRAALDKLPLEFREILVLRELESLSYKEIAEATGLPMGTVMSRLSRARDRLEKLVTDPERGDIERGA